MAQQPQGTSGRSGPPSVAHVEETRRIVPFIITGSSDEFAKKFCAEQQLTWMKCLTQHGKTRCDEDWKIYNQCHAQAKVVYHATRAGTALAESKSSKQIDLMLGDARREASPAYLSFDNWHSIFPSPLVPDWRTYYESWTSNAISKPRAS